MLLGRNTLVVPRCATPMRLTMIIGMATLYSGFARAGSVDRVAFRTARQERAAWTRRLFRDVFGRFSFGTVAKRRHFGIVQVLLVAALLPACASVGGLSAGAPAEVKRDAVAERAKARWDALIKLDIAGAYAYLSPASRATMPLDLYRAKHRVGLYRAVKVDGVDCDADACTVSLSLTYDYKRFKGITTRVVEKWIIADGQAWFVDQG